MNGVSKQDPAEELSSKEFRDAFVAEHLKTGVAYQIRALREKRGWSQAELGRRAGKPQSAISRLEDPDYGRLSLKTLLELAAAFDVALLVQFAAFSELLKRFSNLSPEALAVPDFAHDNLRPAPAMGGAATAQVRDISARGPSASHVSVLHSEAPRQRSPSLLPNCETRAPSSGSLFSSLQQASAVPQRPRLAA
ncbi:MAG: helix-turn-helix domain-containing protein [Geminicoccaceae bacterium]